MSVWSLAFGCIIGWGAFMMPGTTFLPTAGTLGTTVAMVVGALVMVVIAFSYSYMVAHYPKAGGEVNFARACFGHGHAYLCGWFLALAYLANVPMNCTALGLMTRKLFFGTFQFGRLYAVAGYDIWLGEVLLALAVLTVIAWLSVHGVRKAGWVQTVMAVSLAAAFLIIVVATLFSPVTHWSNLAPFWGPGGGEQLTVNGEQLLVNGEQLLVNGQALTANHQSLTTSPLAGILAIVAVAPWAYVGFETIPQAAEEFSFSVRKVNLIMIVAIAFGCVVYSCNNLVTAAASPDWTAFIAQHDWAVGAAVEALMGKPGLVVLGIAIASAILTGILGFLTATSRLLYSMARDGYIPARYAQLHPKYGTPYRAILFCYFLSAVGPWFGRTALGWFVDMSAIGGAIGFGYATASCWHTIRRRGDRRPFLLASAVLGTLCSIGFVALLLVPGLPGCLNAPSYAMLGVWIAFGIAFRILMGRVRK